MHELQVYRLDIQVANLICSNGEAQKCRAFVPRNTQSSPRAIAAALTADVLRQTNSCDTEHSLPGLPDLRESGTCVMMCSTMEQRPLESQVDSGFKYEAADRRRILPAESRVRCTTGRRGGAEGAGAVSGAAGKGP